MIKSPLTSPLRPALTSPYELITRSVFELNGTQWGELSETVVLAGDFEIEVKYLKSGTSTTTFFGGKLENINCVVMDFNSNRLRAFAYDENGDISSVLQASQTDSDAAADGRIHVVRLVYVSGQASILVDGVLVAEGYWGLATSVEVTQALSRTLNGFREFVGVVFDFKIWTNGDRNTGELILNVPFDESGSDYQRNRAVALGEELAGKLAPVAIGSTWDSLGGGRYRAVSDGSYLTIKWPCTSGVKYLVRFDVEYLGSGGLRLNSATDLTSWDFGSTDRTITHLVEADGTNIGIKHDNSCDFIISNISIREWSGVILQSALPEDWMKIEKKRWWDYWLGVKNYWGVGSPTITYQSTYDSVNKTAHVISDDGTMSQVYFQGATIGQKYNFSLNVYEMLLGRGRFKIGTDTQGVQITGNGNYSTDFVADGTNVEVKREAGSLCNYKVRNVSVRRKLEIAS